MGFRVSAGVGCRVSAEASAEASPYLQRCRKCLQRDLRLQCCRENSVCAAAGGVSENTLLLTAGVNTVSTLLLTARVSETLLLTAPVNTVAWQVRGLQLDVSLHRLLFTRPSASLTLPLCLFVSLWKQLEVSLQKLSETETNPKAKKQRPSRGGEEEERHPAATSRFGEVRFH